jgi:DNA topoisomerase I
MIDCVAQRLNNTRTVCRKSYIHPGVIEAYLDHSLPEHYQAVVRRAGRTPSGLTRDEHVAHEILRALAKMPAAR